MHQRNYQCTDVCVACLCAGSTSKAVPAASPGQPTFGPIVIALPDGGTCSRLATTRTFDRANVCAVVDAPMDGRVDRGTWTPRIEAALIDQLDR